MSFPLSRSGLARHLLSTPQPPEPLESSRKTLNTLPLPLSRESLKERLLIRSPRPLSRSGLARHVLRSPGRISCCFVCVFFFVCCFFNKSGDTHQSEDTVKQKGEKWSRIQRSSTKHTGSGLKTPSALLDLPLGNLVDTR
jgi:hypothetical protein